jgi:hypothetical protein
MNWEMLSAIGQIVAAIGVIPSFAFAAWFHSRRALASDGKLLLPDAYSRWCASRDNTIGPHVRSDFRITSPPPNAHYEIDPVLPPSQQMIELTAAASSDVEWFVNGMQLSPQRDGGFFWQLAPGEWNVRASSDFGTAQETITVE